jgi:protein ImuB
MLWLAIHLPLLSLEALCATLAEADRQRPVVLLDGHQVSAVNAAAALCGIRPGLKRATALALAADLLPGQADAARDDAALQAVAHVALAFTPSVALHGPQTVLLEVQASLRYFGGLAVLHRRLLDALARFSHPVPHRVQLAAAPTALGAAWLARWHPRGQGDLVQGAHATQAVAWRRLLGELPVHLLGADPAQTQALQAMGLYRLADLQPLPRDGLARRFGQNLLDGIDRACGDRPDPREWLALPAAFESRLELYARADSTEQVLLGAAVLLARLVAWAQARQARVAAFTLCMQHERSSRPADDTAAAATDLRIELAEPALDAAHLQLLLRERLAHCVLAAPTLELRLHCRHVVQASAPNGELFPTRASESAGLARLLERLRARLGDTQVQRLVAVADHRPERASLAVLAQGAMSSDKTRGDAFTPASAGLPLHRPAWLLPEALPLAERGALPWLEGRPLQLVSGPERIEAGWWDGAPSARDYFIAQAEDGSLVWLWRGRLPAVQGDAQWFLQGRFA